MKGTTIIVVVVFFILLIFGVGLAVNKKINDKEAIQQKLIELESKSPVIINNYPQTIVTTEMNKEAITQAVEETAVSFFNGMTVEYDCNKIEVVGESSMMLNCLVR